MPERGLNRCVHVYFVKREKMKRLLRVLKHLDSNFIIAISALIVSMCALYVSFQEVRIMRTQQKATMYPYLTLGRSYSAEGFEVYLRNSGTGLARINSCQVRNQEQFFTGWGEVIKTYLPDSLVFGYESYNTSSIIDEFITPNETVKLFVVPWTPASRTFEKSIRDLQFEICYSSLLDDYWILDNEGRHPVEEVCEVVAEQQFR